MSACVRVGRSAKGRGGRGFVELGVRSTRTLAGVGSLVSALELGTDLHPMQVPKPADEVRPDMYAVCPQEAVATPAIDKDEVFRKAMEKSGTYNRAPAAAAPEGPLSYMKGGDFDAAPAPTSPAADNAAQPNVPQ